MKTPRSIFKHESKISSIYTLPVERFIWNFAKEPRHSNTVLSTPLANENIRCIHTEDDKFILEFIYIGKFLSWVS